MVALVVPFRLHQRKVEATYELVQLSVGASSMPKIRLAARTRQSADSAGSRRFVRKEREHYFCSAFFGDPDLCSAEGSSEGR